MPDSHSGRLKTSSVPSCVDNTGFGRSLSCRSPMFGSQELEKLAPFVDAFSLMTYDYSSHAR